MENELAVASPGPVRTPPLRIAAGVVAFAIITVAALSYAKWLPYSHKLAAVLTKGTFSGKPILSAAGSAGAAPSWHDGWHFAGTYAKAVWIALVAGILIGAAVEVLLPRRTLLSFMQRSTPGRSAFSGAVLAVPCMMCTCCAAPITVGMRRSQVSRPAALAYWLGNPLLNPVVLVIVFVVLPWQLSLVRFAIGAGLVFLAAPLIGRMGRADRAPSTAADLEGDLTERTEADSGLEPRPGVMAYLKAVARLAVLVLPEYVVAVLLLGAFRGWLLPLGHSAGTWVFGATIVAAVAGTLLVVPTAGEVPVVIALLTAGLPLVVAATLLVALPAVSLPSLLMVGRAMSWRVMAAVAGAVMVAAAAAGTLAALLT